MTRANVTDTEHLVQQLREDFVARHGGEPDAVAVAPGRVNLIGEHVDYNGGRCLPMAISQATYAAVRLRPDSPDGPDTTVTIGSRQQADAWAGDVARLGPGDATGWAAYAAGVVWAMRERGVDVPGFDVLVDGHVPLGAGLSSSAALECSVALAVNAALGRPDSEEARHVLIEDCIRAERDVAGAPTGGMDQTVSLLGSAGHALLLDCATGETADVPWQPEAAGLALLIVDTRAEHALVDGGYADRRAACEAAAAALGVGLLAEVTDHDAALEALAGHPVRQRRARHVFTEVRRVDAAVAALEAGDFAAFGELLTASHVSLRDDFEVSCAELDVTVEACLSVGALGARMTGGGFGGSAIALLPDAAVEPAVAACTEAFASHGWAAPRFLRATAAGGARVVD
jgi:galactokinase